MGMFSGKPKPTQSATGRKPKHTKDPKGAAATRGWHSRALDREIRTQESRDRWGY